MICTHQTGCITNAIRAAPSTPFFFTLTYSQIIQIQIQITQIQIQITQIQIIQKSQVDDHQ